MLNKQTTNQLFSELIQDILNEPNLDQKKLNNLKIQYAKKYNFGKIIKNPEIIAYATEQNREQIIQKLNIKPIRELSGVTVVALFAKPHLCPHGKCMYCPGGIDSPFGDTPQSYTGKEPAAMRAIRNNYDPYFQIFNRLEHYIINGHLPDKLELIFMGGTFPSLNQQYKENFVKNVYKAINDFGDLFINIDKNQKKSINYEKFNDFFQIKDDFKSTQRRQQVQQKMLKLKNQNLDQTTYQQEITKCETGKIRPIGLTIETKPDWAQEKHVNEMLKYGVTRFEVGVQTLNEKCLKQTNRGHTLNDTKKSFQIMKDCALKINAHMMLGLPASNLQIDEQSLINLFKLPEYRPDMLKIYPCLVVQGTPLYKMWEQKKFQPIDTQKAAKIIAETYKQIPRYVRVMRVQRDIPTTEVNEGIQNSNLRQFVEKEMKTQNIKSKDIRAREIGFRQLQKIKPGNFEIKIEKYQSSQGTDYFLDVADENDTMIGFIRLRFPHQTNLRAEIDNKTALIRELHIYGQTIPVGENSKQNLVQHKGWGKKLLQKAEQIAIENGYQKMIIISGIGVREYYKKTGYKLQGPYMAKQLIQN